MEINNFSSFFEFLGGLNIGYVAINYFKKDFSEKVFKPSKRIFEKLRFQIDRIDAQLSEVHSLSEKDKASLENLRQSADVFTKDLDETELNHRFFLELFEPIFLLIGIYCLFTLLVGGFQNESLEILGANNLEKTYAVFIFLLGVFCAVFSFSIFFGSFSKRILLNKVKLSLFQIVIAFLVFTAISFIIAFYMGDCINNNKFLIALLLLPGVIYAILSYWNIREVERYNEKKTMQILDGIITLCKVNFWYTILYLTLLLIFIMPVFLYCFDSKAHIYPMYLVILTVPFLLFILIAIRVYIHRYKFQQEYDNKAEILASSLDLILPKNNKP